ncbi:MAG: YraN family protein [Betaproteobacteria bacterium]
MPTTPSKKERGPAAEALAERYLVDRGLVILARNWRRRRGEIDIIARDGATLVFVEVRLRTRSDYGGAAGSITAAKRARLTATAEQYLAGCRRPPACRFDAILLDALETSRIEWLRDII